MADSAKILVVIYQISLRSISEILKLNTVLSEAEGIVLYCGRFPAANASGCSAAEGLLYKPWSLVVPTCSARCLHQRP